MEQKINSADLELKDRLVAINRVTKVTKGGRTFSFSAIVVVGDENGTVGYGLGKANEVTTAIAKGVEAAKKNLIKVPVLKGTLPHEQEAKYSGATVFMRPASLIDLFSACSIRIAASSMTWQLLASRPVVSTSRTTMASYF